MTSEAWCTGVTKFEAHAASTDRLADDDFATALLGLVSEVGGLVGTLKKWRRDADSFFGYRDAVVEELGDVLWYTSAVARRGGTFLTDIAVIVSSEPNSLTNPAEIDLHDASALEGGTFEGSLLNLVGEAGGLASRHRAGAYADNAHALRDDLVRFMKAWVKSAVASQVSLEEVVQLNISKRESRWPTKQVYPAPVDEGLHIDEQLPHKLRILVYERKVNGTNFVFQKTGSFLLGDRLTDNHMPPDDYRFHDVFHLAYAAVLGWSPTTRALLKIKRKSRKEIDENEDGARAILIEEGLATWIFETAKQHRFFENTETLGLDLLKDVTRFVRGYEAESLPMWLWESAILQGYAVFRELRKARYGVVLTDRAQRRIWFEPMTAEDKKLCGMK